MVVISITITASLEEIVSGIPRFITLSANIPSNIYYSLDGSTPDINSTIYTGQITLPTNQTVIVLQVFATNGVDSSPIVSQTYEVDILGPDLRVGHSGTNAAAQSVPTVDQYPFGTPPIMPNQIFTGIGSAGNTVDDPTLPEFPTGYDGNGNPTGFTNEQLVGIPTETQLQVFSETNVEGERGYGIGTIPRHTVAKSAEAPPEQSTYNSALFDPRAMVTIQDLTKPQDPNLPAFINRAYFTTENKFTRTGNLMFNTALDSPPTTGSLVRVVRDTVNNVVKFYYFDDVGDSKWIISTIPADGLPNITRNYSEAMVPMTNTKGGKVGSGGRFVYRWYWPLARYLY